MEINENGIKIDTQEEIIAAFIEELLSKYGSDFYIKSEGALDNISVINSLLCSDIEELIQKFAEQYNPETAESIYQDALYERIGVSRNDAQKTTFVRKVLGAANLVCGAGSMTIRATSDNQEYSNISDFTLNNDGYALVDFICADYGEIEVNSDENFTIITAPDGVTDTEEAEDMQLSIGRVYESDEDYRIRFRNSKSLNARSTRNANLSNLMNYVDDTGFLTIITKNDDNNLEPGQIMIIAHHNTTDNIFADAIFKTVADGIEYLGDTEVTLYDDLNLPVTVYFQNATKVSISVKAEVSVEDGYYINTVLENVSENILEYIENMVYGLGATIYAIRLSTPILDTDGVKSVNNLKVKRTDDAEYSDKVTLERYEVPIFDSSFIELS